MSCSKFLLLIYVFTRDISFFSLSHLPSKSSYQLQNKTHDTQSPWSINNHTQSSVIIARWNNNASSLQWSQAYHLRTFFPLLCIFFFFCKYWQVSNNKHWYGIDDIYLFSIYCQNIQKIVFLEIHDPSKQIPNKFSINNH